MKCLYLVSKWFQNTISCGYVDKYCFEYSEKMEKERKVTVRNNREKEFFDFGVK